MRLCGYVPYIFHKRIFDDDDDDDDDDVSENSFF